MDRERVLTVSGAFVAVAMAGLLAYTTVNGRTLGPPRVHPRAGTDLLEHELRALVVDQVAYHERQRRFTANLAELDFAPYDPGTIVKVVAADSEGWTAVAVSYESRMACVLSVGKGRAAGASTESYFASYDVIFDSVATCTVADTSVHHEEILEVPDSLQGPEGAPVRLDSSHVPGAPSRRPR